MSNENNSFKNTVYLPEAIQVSPVRSMIALDVNGDGKDDLIGIGNLKDSEVETTAYDAGIGFCAISTNGKLTVLPPSQSGFFVRGDSRDLKLVPLHSGKKLIIVSKYNAPIEAFELTQGRSSKIALR